MKVGDRVRLTVDYDILPKGELGTVSWHHPGNVYYHWRVAFDNASHEVEFGMTDIGWLVAEDEVEVIS